MKKIILFYFILFSAKIFAGQSFIKEVIQKKIIKEKKAFLISEKADEKRSPIDSVLEYDFLYDKNGRPLKNVSYRDGEQLLLSEYEYDAMGRKIKFSTANNSIHMKNSFSYKYDAKGNITEETCYENGKEIEYRKIFKYNSDGKKILELQVSEDKKVESKNVFDYDQHGNLIKLKMFDPKDSIITRYDYNYDLNNNLIAELRYDRNHMEWKYEYEYNDHNKKVKEMHWYPSETSNSSIKFKYDQTGHLTEETTLNNKSQVIQTKSFRFENDKMIEEITGNLKTIYEYDTLGNKTKEAIYADDGGLSIKSFNNKGDVLSYAQYSSDQKFSYEEIYQYDPQTYLKIKVSKRNTDQTISEDIEYKYNRYGDLTEQISKDNNTHMLTINKYVYQYYE